MSTETLILILGRLAAGFLASFLALWIWSRTREPYWLMIVLGTVFYFGDTVLLILDQIGLSVYTLFVVQEISVLKVAAAILPFVFFVIGFSIFLARRR